MIEVEGITARHGRSRIDDVSFTVESGTVALLMGPERSGTSLVLQCLAGTLKPSAGRLSINGHPVRFGGHPRVRACWGPAIIGRRSARAWMRASAATLGVPEVEADDLLERAGLPLGRREGRINRLNLKEQQRLAIAHAFLGQPEVLLLAHPFAGMDATHLWWLHDVFRSHTEQGGTVVASAADVTDVAECADQCLVMADGRLLKDVRPRSSHTDVHTLPLALMQARAVHHDAKEPTR